MDSRFRAASSEDVLLVIHADREMPFIRIENRAAMGSVCARQISSEKGDSGQASYRASQEHECVGVDEKGPNPVCRYDFCKIGAVWALLILAQLGLPPSPEYSTEQMRQ